MLLKIVIEKQYCFSLFFKSQVLLVNLVDDKYKTFIKTGDDKLKETMMMSLKWTDSLEIAIALDEKYPNIEPQVVNFVDLRQMILQLEQFDDNPNHCGEKVLEAIQMAWIDEK